MNLIHDANESNGKSPDDELEPSLRMTRKSQRQARDRQGRPTREFIEAFAVKHGIMVD
jgi:hypothetical protein